MGNLAGAVVPASDAALGNANNAVILSGNSAASAAVLEMSGGFTSSRNILITNATASANGLFTNGPGVATLHGNIGRAQIGMPLLKSGSGTLVLTAANNLNGPVTIGETLPTRRPSAPTAQTGGTVVLSGPNGGLPMATAYSLNNGTTLVLDNTAGVNFNRLSSSSVTMNGAELKLIGHASDATFDHVGRDTANGLVANSLGNTLTVSQPGSGGNNTNLVFTVYIANGSAVTLFLGTNLGASSGRFGRVIFATAPTLISGIIPGAFHAASDDGAPTNFATYISSTNGVEAFTAYTPLPCRQRRDQSNPYRKWIIHRYG